MQDPKVLAMKAKLRLLPSDELADAKPIRQAIVTAKLADGREVSRRTFAVKGVIENPMSFADVELKSRDLVTPLLGGSTDEFIQMIRTLENVADIKDLRRFLQPVTNDQNQ